VIKITGQVMLISNLLEASYPLFWWWSSATFLNPQPSVFGKGQNQLRFRNDSWACLKNLQAVHFLTENAQLPQKHSLVGPCFVTLAHTMRRIA